ncbi:MAG: TlpA family protein disulfide reductase [Candidatus Latescibacteria bacterium]|nr:TlpA family protein disulfide reductase [Candidatus Latescibacterota bacterium]
MRKSILLFVMGCLLSGAVGPAFGQEAKNDQKNGQNQLKVGDQAPTFVLKALNGETVFLRDYCGKELRPFHKTKYVVILSFFASWCVPCRTEIPILQQFYETFKDEPLKVFLVNYTPSEQDLVTHQPISDSKRRLEVVREFVKEQGYTLPVLLDEFGTAARNFKVADDRDRARLPHLFVIDRDGYLRLINTGFSGSPREFQRELITTISPLLQDPLPWRPE